jgi:flagellar hook protein FlgE
MTSGLYGALFAGVTGLAVQSQAMGMIADNITNVNTVGYKRTHAQFSSLVTQAATQTSYSPGGVQARPQLLVDKQGLLQSSASNTDLAINGDGFFVVNEGANPVVGKSEFLFTRAGSFVPDNSGNLRSAAGLFLQAWPINAAGDIPTNQSDLALLETVNLSGLNGTAETTTTLGLAANLNSSQAINPAVSGGTYSVGDIESNTVASDFERTIPVTDSKGGTRSVTFGFLKGTATNRWLAEVFVEPASENAGATGLIASGTIAFNTDGSLDTTNTTAALNSLSITWTAALGLAPSTIAVDYGTNGKTDGMTQFDSASLLIQAETDGAAFGALSDIGISEEGVITALFDNGTRRDIYKLPIATFDNPNGLGNRSGNAFIATEFSGELKMSEAGLGGVGLVAPSALESSTVDLGEEFTNMIITQRAFSAAGKTITVADEMLEELIRLKR